MSSRQQPHIEHFSQRAPILEQMDMIKLAEIASKTVTISSNIGTGSRLVGKNDFERHNKKSLLLSINGSLKGWADGIDSAVYRLDPAESHIFQQIASVVDGKVTYTGDVSKTVILDMTIESVSSAAPVPIGVNFPNVVPTQVGSNGKMYAYIIMPHQSGEVNQVIRKEANITRAQLASIGAINVDTLLDHTLAIHNTGTTIVPIGTNMYNFLWEHGKDIGIDLSKQDPGPYGMHKFTDQAIEDAVGLAKQLTNLPLDNMLTFEAQFERADTLAWDDKTGVADNNGASGRMTNKYPVYVKVGISYQNADIANSA